MSGSRVLVAGVGNIFLGDDAFGVVVARELMARPQPDGVTVADFGIRGLDLTYALLDGYEAAVIVDATPRGGQPGTLYVIEPEVGAGDVPGLDMHTLEPVKVLRLAASLGSSVRRLLVVGCEPAVADPDEMADGLSDPVRAAVAEAVPLVESLAAKLLAGEPVTARESPIGGPT